MGYNKKKHLNDFTIDYDEAGPKLLGCFMSRYPELIVKKC